MATASEKKADELNKQIEELKSDVASLTKSLKEMGEAKADEAKAAAKDMAKAAKEQGEAYVATASDSMDEVLTYVRDKPANAVAIAAGIGFLLGMMSGRR